MPSSSRPQHGVRRYEQLDPGWSECYECGGDGACTVCGGHGKANDRRCSNCNGTGRCIVCHGLGQVAPEKKRLTFIGTYREFDLDADPNNPSLADARGRRAPNHKVEVVAYLLAGKPMVVSPGGSGTDVFDPTRKTTSKAILTDGEYAWSMELAYYVEQYDVLLPEPFERHMASLEYRVPTVDTSKLTLPW